MSDILEPLFLEAQDGISVSLDGDQGRLSFRTSRQIVTVAMPRSRIEQLHHAIGAKLKEAPLHLLAGFKSRIGAKPLTDYARAFRHV